MKQSKQLNIKNNYSIKSKNKSGTCILATKFDHQIFLAGDRQLTTEYSKYHSPKPKIKRLNKDILLGYSGDSFIGNIVFDLFKFPEFKTNANTSSYIINQLIPGISKFLKQGEYSSKELILLIIIRDEAWEISFEEKDNDMVVSAGMADFPCAIGHGSDYAVGAWEGLYSYIDIEYLEETHKENMVTALKIASKYSTCCDDDIDVLVHNINPIKSKVKSKGK